jgi:hypothetical protein
MIVVLAAGLLLLAVVLLVLRPLIRPDRGESGPEIPPDADALELAIAERRARMAAREETRR